MVTLGRAEYFTIVGTAVTTSASTGQTARCNNALIMVDLPTLNWPQKTTWICSAERRSLVSCRCWSRSVRPWLLAISRPVSIAAMISFTPAAGSPGRDSAVPTGRARVAELGFGMGVAAGGCVTGSALDTGSLWHPLAPPVSLWLRRCRLGLRRCRLGLRRCRLGRRRCRLGLRRCRLGLRRCRHRTGGLRCGPQGGSQVRRPTEAPAARLPYRLFPLEEVIARTAEHRVSLVLGATVDAGDHCSILRVGCGQRTAISLCQVVSAQAIASPHQARGPGFP